MLMEKVKCYIKQLLEQQTTIEEIGVVIELRAKRLAVVQCDQKDGCSGCGAAGGCCVAGTGANGKGKRRLFVDNIPHARVGDSVRVEVETRAGIADSQSFLYVTSFIMLALGLAVGYFIASLLPVGVPAALLALLIGCAFMVGTMGVLRFGRQAVVQTSLAKIKEIVATNDGHKKTN
ncbi:MAG: SoxR reducing system RseC family protein [Thermodesulfobacteriota bacterium]|nr:SoxR reducing system RseC family protein [Thermodesulfobacteriota bacterium]